MWETCKFPKNYKKIVKKFEGNLMKYLYVEYIQTEVS